MDNSYEPISAREISQLLLNKKFHNLGGGEQKRPRARVLHYLSGGKQSVHPVSIDLLKTESGL